MHTHNAARPSTDARQARSNVEGRRYGGTDTNVVLFVCSCLASPRASYGSGTIPVGQHCTPRAPLVMTRCHHAQHSLAAPGVPLKPLHAAVWLWAALGVVSCPVRDALNRPATPPGGERGVRERRFRSAAALTDICDAQDRAAIEANVRCRPNRAARRAWPSTVPKTRALRRRMRLRLGTPAVSG